MNTMATLERPLPPPFFFLIMMLNARLPRNDVTNIVIN